MTSSQKISALAEKAVEACDKYNAAKDNLENPEPGQAATAALLAFTNEVSPSAWLALRNEVLEECRKAVEAWPLVYGLLPLCDEEQNISAETGQYESRERIAEMIEALKHERPA